MNHEARLKVTSELLKGDITPPLDFFDKYVYPMSSEAAVLNIYEWFQEQGLA